MPTFGLGSLKTIKLWYRSRPSSRWRARALGLAAGPSGRQLRRWGLVAPAAESLAMKRRSPRPSWSLRWEGPGAATPFVDSRTVGFCQPALAPGRYCTAKRIARLRVTAGSRCPSVNLPRPRHTRRPGRFDEGCEYLTNGALSVSTVQITFRGTAQSPWLVVVLSVVTLGIYHLFWYYFFTREMADYGDAHSTHIGMSPAVSVRAVTICGVVIIPPFVSVFTPANGCDSHSASPSRTHVGQAVALSSRADLPTEEFGTRIPSDASAGLAVLWMPGFDVSQPEGCQGRSKTDPFGPVENCPPVGGRGDRRPVGETGLWGPLPPSPDRRVQHSVRL